MIKGYAMALGLRNCKIHPIRPNGQRPQFPLGGKHSAPPPHPLMMARSPAGPRWARPSRVPRCPSDSATGAGSGASGGVLLLVTWQQHLGHFVDLRMYVR